MPLLEPPTHRHLLRDQVFDHLKRAVINGELEPGELLSNAQMEERLGVSRSPIRDALNRLETIGLVETVPNRHTRVTDIDESATTRIADVIARILDTYSSSRSLTSSLPLGEVRDHIDHYRMLLERAATLTGNPEVSALLLREWPRLERMLRLRPKVTSERYTAIVTSSAQRSSGAESLITELTSHMFGGGQTDRSRPGTTRQDSVGVS